MRPDEAAPYPIGQLTPIIDLDRVCRLPDVDALLELINEGAYDEHIEAILAAGHARKRTRRGVRRPYGLTR